MYKWYEIIVVTCFVLSMLLLPIGFLVEIWMATATLGLKILFSGVVFLGVCILLGAFNY